MPQPISPTYTTLSHLLYHLRLFKGLTPPSSRNFSCVVNDVTQAIKPIASHDATQACKITACIDATQACKTIVMNDATQVCKITACIDATQACKKNSMNDATQACKISAYYFKGVSKKSAVQNSNAKGGTPITKEDRSQRYTRSRSRSKSKSLQQITLSSQHLQKQQQ